MKKITLLMLSLFLYVTDQAQTVEKSKAKPLF